MIRFKILLDRFLENKIESEVVRRNVPPAEVDSSVAELNRTAVSNETYRWEPEVA